MKDQIKIKLNQQEALDQLKANPPRPNAKLLNQAMDILINEEIREENKSLIKKTIKEIKE